MKKQPPPQKSYKAKKAVQKIAKQGRLGLEPNARELERLMAMFSAGKYSEAESIALAMTKSFPRFGVGWKALGAVLHEQCRGKEALLAKQKAVTLLPQDAEAHSNLGFSYRDSGQLTEAETHCRRALDINPHYAEAHGNLGLVLWDQGRLIEAEASCRRAIEIMPSLVNAYNNLGNILFDQGRLSEAETSYRQALALRPDFIDASNNLGITLLEQGLILEAEDVYRHTLEIKPDYADAYNFLGNCLLAQGRMKEAEASYRHALELKPEYVSAYYNLGNILCDFNCWDQAVDAYRKSLDFDPAKMGLKASVWLAVIYYLEGNLDLSGNMLQTAQPIMDVTSVSYKDSTAYYHYLNKLITWHKQTSSSYPQSVNREVLYTIGESHSISSHGTIVYYHGREMQCEAQWIAGCKQWHLGNDKQNKYKYKFELIMRQLPAQSTILLLIGEIDCRPDEGILKAWKKTPEKSLDEIAMKTAQTYMGYVSKSASHYGHRLIIGGVPATYVDLCTVAVEDVEPFIRLIKIFNVFLQELALTAELDFLDIYTLTDSGEGVSNGKWHIDGYHLFPDAIEEAFSKYLITAAK
ncbi:tetratricopeptide repeat protein [Candidatus Methylospira mobilis]|uniref:tetratricopeptide repeat protein n=1 Tax=Candidatus Methylospira mobilis TaxID=1808979 RepID=UPI0028E77818|nr:tetratricopeptide repeat protein [Candidatus Methylospira mobilis]WNV05373.1 tetratricopeptide repeat protein [Candidatus Methylospira mobilis]